MSQVTIYGPSLSTYVRTARLVCEEKGVAYDLKEVGFGTPELQALHPFSKVPAFQHGDFRLFETIAIARYVEAVFPGQKLWPADPKQAAIVDQWISAATDYAYPTIIHQVVLPRFGMKPLDEAAVKATVPRIDDQLKVFSRALEKGPFFLGADLTAADLFLAPIIFYLRMTPEAGVLQNHPNLARWFETVSSRPSFASTMPKLPG